MNPSKRRLSILKVPKAREPLSDIDFNPSSADDDGTTKEITRGRRVSFCRKSNVAEFTSDNCTTQLIFKQDTSLVTKFEKSDSQTSIFDRINTSVQEINNDFPSSTNRFNPNVSMVGNMCNFHPEMSSDLEPTEAFINYKLGDERSIIGNAAFDDDDIREQIEQLRQESIPILTKINIPNDDFGCITEQFSNLRNEIPSTNDGDMSITDAIPIPIQVVDSNKNLNSAEFQKKKKIYIDLDDDDKSPSTLEKKNAEKENILTSEMLALVKSSKQKNPKFEILNNLGFLSIPETTPSTVPKSVSKSCDKLFSSEIFNSTTKPGLKRANINITRTSDQGMSFKQSNISDSPSGVCQNDVHREVILATKIARTVEDDIRNDIQCFTKSDPKVSMTCDVAKDAFKDNIESNMHLLGTNMSMTNVINRNQNYMNLTPPAKPLIEYKNNQETHNKSRKIEMDNLFLSNMSMTHAIPNAFKDHSETVMYLGDTDMSMTNAVNRNWTCASKSPLVGSLIAHRSNQEAYDKFGKIERELHHSSVYNMSMTHAVPNSIKDHLETDMYLRDTDMSMTHAVNRNRTCAYINSMLETPIEHKTNHDTNNESQQIETELYNASVCNMSMTHAIPSSNQKKVNYNTEFRAVEMSMVQCIPSENNYINNKSLCDPLRFSENNSNYRFTDDESKTNKSIHMSMTSVVPASLSLIVNRDHTQSEDCEMSVTRAIATRWKDTFDGGKSQYDPLEPKIDNINQSCININTSELFDSQLSKIVDSEMIIPTSVNKKNNNDINMKVTGIVSLDQEEAYSKKLTGNLSIKKNSEQDDLNIYNQSGQKAGFDLEADAQTKLNITQNDFKASKNNDEGIVNNVSNVYALSESPDYVQSNEQIFLDPPEAFGDIVNNKHIEDKKTVKQIASVARNIPRSVISNVNNFNTISSNLTSDHSTLPVANESKIRNELICDDRSYKQTVPDVTNNALLDFNTNKVIKKHEHHKIRKNSHSDMPTFEQNTKPLKDNADKNTNIHSSKKIIYNEPSISATGDNSASTITSLSDLPLTFHQIDLVTDGKNTSSNFNKSTLNMLDSNSQVEIQNSGKHDEYVLQKYPNESNFTTLPILTNVSLMKSSEVLGEKSKISEQQNQSDLSEPKESVLLASSDVKKIIKSLETSKLNVSETLNKSSIEIVKPAITCSMDTFETCQDTNKSRVILADKIKNNFIQAESNSSIAQNVELSEVENKKGETEQGVSSEPPENMAQCNVIEDNITKIKVINKSRNDDFDIFSIANSIVSSKDKCTTDESQCYTVMFGEISHICSNTTVEPYKIDKSKKSSVVQSTPQKNISKNNTTASCDTTCIPDIPIKTSSKIPQPVKRGCFSPSKTYICEAKKIKSVDDQNDKILNTTHTNLCQPLDKKCPNLENPVKFCSTSNPNSMHTKELTYVINKEEQQKFISRVEKVADGDFIIYNESPPASLLDFSHPASFLDVSPPSYASINISSEDNADILQIKNKYNTPSKSLTCTDENKSMVNFKGKNEEKSSILYEVCVNVMPNSEKRKYEICASNVNNLEKDSLTNTNYSDSIYIDKNLKDVEKIKNNFEAIDNDDAKTENKLNVIAVTETMNTSRAFVQKNNNSNNIFLPKKVVEEILKDEQKLPVLNTQKMNSTEINSPSDNETLNMNKMNTHGNKNISDFKIIEPKSKITNSSAIPIDGITIGKTVDNQTESHKNSDNSGCILIENKLENVKKNIHDNNDQLNNINIAKTVNTNQSFLKKNKYSSKTTFIKKLPEDKTKVQQKLSLLNTYKKSSSQINSLNNVDVIIEPKAKTPKLLLQDTIRSEINGLSCLLEQSTNNLWEILLMKSKLSMTVIVKPQSENVTGLDPISEIKVTSIFNENLRCDWERKSSVDLMLIKIALHHLNSEKILKMYPHLGHLPKLVKHCCDFVDHLLKLRRELKRCYLLYGIQINDNNRLTFNTLNTHVGAIWLITMDLELCNLPYPSVSQNIFAKTTSGNAIISDTEMHTVASKVKRIHQNSWSVIPRMCEAIWAYCLREKHKTDS